LTQIGPEPEKLENSGSKSEKTALPYQDSVISMALNEKHGRYEVHYTQNDAKRA
jgi:hypothetical protein